jgi:hypothetical protein
MDAATEVVVEHERQFIRYAAAAQLLGAAPKFATLAGPRIWPARIIPWKHVELPALALYTSEDAVDGDSQWTAPRELKHSLQLVIECGVDVDASKKLDEQLDNLCKSVELAMDRDITFGGWASWSALSRTDQELLEIGNRPIGSARMTYDVRYYSDAAGDDAAFNLLQIDSKWNLGGVQAPADLVEDLVRMTQ